MTIRRTAGSALAGLATTLFMEYASTAFYDRQSAQSREREEQLRTEMPTTTLVRKTAALLGTELDDQRAETLGTLSHYTFGAAGGPAALALRRLGFGPLGAGVAVATGMEVVVDQGMNTVLGLTAPPRAWPWQAHVRGVVAHAVYGVALGLLLAAGAED
jgi:hypothetical protein